MQDIRSTRRSFLKACAALGGLTIASRAIVEAQAADPQTLSWLCYPGHAAPEVVGPFEQENNVKILAKEYSGGEKMMALINGSPPGSFDVVTSDEAYVSELIKADYIEQLNPADFPLGEFWPDFQKFPLHWVDGKLYTIMTSWGANGLIYNADKLSADDASSYAIMWDPRLKGKLGMRDWYLPCMGCVSLAMGNKPKPYDIDGAKFAAMLAKMNALKPSVVGFWDFAGEFDSFANGNAWVVPGSGEWMAGLLQKDGHNVLSSVPKEGAVIWTEFGLHRDGHQENGSGEGVHSLSRQSRRSAPAHAEDLVYGQRPEQGRMGEPEQGRPKDGEGPADGSERREPAERLARRSTCASAASDAAIARGLAGSVV